MTTAIDDLSGVALNKALALALGYRIEPYQDVEAVTFYHQVNGPDGFHDMLEARTIEAAWLECFQPEPECGATILPDWAGDLNVALGLLVRTLMYDFSLMRSAGYDDWRASMYPDIDVNDIPSLEFPIIRANNIDPRIAVCRVWLKYYVQFIE